MVLGGGDSPERDVSLRSASAVSRALKIAGYEVIEADPKNGIEALDGFNGIVFPILHDKGGEDGQIQAELEERHLPFLGTESNASAVCFDKSSARRILLAAGLPMAAGGMVNKETYFNHELTTNPHVLKVARGGSSIGTYIIRDPKNVDKYKIGEVFDLDDRAIIEELIEGIEITVPVFDTNALPVIEIKPPTDTEFDYENKYNGATQELCPPVSVSEDLQRQAQYLAEQVHSALGCRHLSRADIIVKKDGSMIVLETNTMPGMTDQSLYPKSASVNGQDMPGLMRNFVDLVKRDYKI